MTPTDVGTSNTQEPAEASRPSLDVTVPVEYRCAVTVEAVVHDAQHRGSPNTPSRQAWLNSLSPMNYEMELSESHSESYRECTYQVKLQGTRWRYVATWNTTSAQLPDSWCEDARGRVAADIQRTTRGCSELHGGAYYGRDLVRM